MKALFVGCGSIAARLTLILGAVVLVVFAASGVALDWALRRELVAQEDAQLSRKAELVQHLVEEASRSGKEDQLTHAFNDTTMVGHNDLWLWLTASDGKALYASGSPARPLVGEGDGRATVDVGGTEPLQALRFTVGGDGIWGGASGVVAVDRTARDRLVARYRIALALVCAFAVALTATFSAIVMKRGLNPLAVLARQARAISPTRLNERLTVAPLDDELQSIARAFNETLDRLETAYRQMEGFNADVAHELRTPLATVIQATHVTLSRPRSEDQLRHVLISNLEELEQMNRLVNDMLFLARADRGEGMVEAQPTSLATEARKVVDFFEAAFEERNINVHVEGDARASCVANLIRRALSNLLSNALRHSSSGATVTIEIKQHEAEIRVSVNNSGMAITPESLVRLFDRFYLADPSRATRGEGFGLGLAIVRAIARMHGGDVFAFSNDHETSIGFTLGRHSTN